MSDGARQHQFRVTLAVDGVDYGIFDTFSGGQGGAESDKYAAGNMGDEESQGGRQTRENVTISRQYRRGRDTVSHKQLDAKRGKGNAVVTKQPLDADRNAYGAPDIYRGTLVGATGPDHDSNSSDASMVEYEIEVVGSIA